MSGTLDGAGGVSVNQMTVSSLSGDGVTTTLIAVSIELPDSNGGAVGVVGSFKKPGGSLTSFNGTITAPSAPGSGSLFWLIQSDVSGTLSTKQSTSAMPTPDVGSVQLFQQTLTPGSTDTADSGSFLVG